jgi:spermidine synthase
VPWHLTTREALRQVRRVLTDEGVYVANVIDHGPLAFARAEAATLGEVFAHVAVLGDPADLGQAPGGDGGNLVLVASDRPLDLAAVQQQLDARDTDWSVLSGGALDAWTGGAMVLTDDHAPVDQLATPYP